MCVCLSSRAFSTLTDTYLNIHVYSWKVAQQNIRSHYFQSVRLGRSGNRILLNNNLYPPSLIVYSFIVVYIIIPKKRDIGKNKEQVMVDSTGRNAKYEKIILNF